MFELYDQSIFLKRSERDSSKVDIRHHKTCPECGRKLVNLYFRNPKGTARRKEWLMKWMCKRCWDKANEIPIL